MQRNEYPKFSHFFSFTPTPFFLLNPNLELNSVPFLKSRVKSYPFKNTYLWIYQSSIMLFKYFLFVKTKLNMYGKKLFLPKSFSFSFRHRHWISPMTVFKFHGCYLWVLRFLFQTFMFELFLMSIAYATAF